jgi:hypothetical protein
MLRSLVVSFALIPTLAQAAPIVVHGPPLNPIDLLDVSYPVPSANCRDVRASYTEYGREFLVEEAEVCWDPNYPDAVTSESLTVWSPGVGSYTYTVDQLGYHYVDYGTITVRFTDANGVAAAPRTGYYYIPTHNFFNLKPDADINAKFGALLQKASALSATASNYHNGHVTSPIAIKLASTILSGWVDMLDYTGWEPVAYGGGGGSAPNNAPQRQCFATLNSGCKAEDPHVHDGETQY